MIYSILIFHLCFPFGQRVTIAFLFVDYLVECSVFVFCFLIRSYWYRILLETIFAGTSIFCGEDYSVFFNGQMYDQFL